MLRDKKLYIQYRLFIWRKIMDKEQKAIERLIQAAEASITILFTIWVLNVLVASAVQWQARKELRSLKCFPSTKICISELLNVC